MSNELAFELHALTIRLDRAADRLLRARFGVSYSRFLALLMVGRLGATSQRTLAERLDVTEASVSRMARVLRQAGLLQVSPATGERRHALALTADGEVLVDGCLALLGQSLADVIQRSGVGAEEYVRCTRRLSAALEENEQRARSTA